MSKFIKLTLRGAGSIIIQADDIEEVIQDKDYSIVRIIGADRESFEAEETTDKIYRLLETKQ